MFDRFDDDARRAVVYAQEEARLANHHDIGAEHLLMGVLRITDELAPVVLHTSLEQVRDQLVGIRPPGDRSPSGHIPFTGNAKTAMELALRTSLELGQNHITTAHLLAGILNVDDRVVTRALTGLNVDPAEAYLRARTWATITTSDERRPSPPQGDWGAAAHGQNMTDKPTRLAQAIPDPAQQRDSLARALQRYGRHEEDCPAPATECTCGLDEALNLPIREEDDT